jgi:hypothetical protein
MNIPRTARGCLLFAATLAMIAAPARSAEVAARPTPAAGLAAGKAAGSTVTRPRAATATEAAAASRPAQAQRPKTANGSRHTTRRTPRDEYGVVLEDGSYSLFYNY